MHRSASCLVSLLLASTASAQVVRGGEIVVADSSAKTIWAATPAGIVVAVHQGAPLRTPAGVAVTAGRDVIVADFGVGIVRIDAAGATTVATGLAGPIRVAVDHDGSYIVTALTGPALLRVTPTGTVTTIASGAPFRRPFGVAVDRNGDYLVADDSGSLYRVTRGGAVTTIHTGFPFRLPQGVALFANGDYAVMDGVTDQVYRVPRGGGTVTSVVGVPVLGNPCGIVSDFEGGVVVSESGIPNGNRLVQVDAAGNLKVIASGAPFSNLEGVAKAPSLRGPTMPVTGPGSGYTLELDVPTAASKIYALAMAGSAHPGIAFPAPDVRGMPLNPDNLFFTTFGIGAPPYTAGWTGVLAPNGTATAGMSLVPLPPGLLAGQRIYLQAVVIDWAAPTGIGALTNVHVLAF